MAALMGTMEHYDAEVTEWTEYTDRLDKANGLTGPQTAGKRRATFLTLTSVQVIRRTRATLQNFQHVIAVA